MRDLEEMQKEMEDCFDIVANDEEGDKSMYD